MYDNSLDILRDLAKKYITIGIQPEQGEQMKVQRVPKTNTFYRSKKINLATVSYRNEFGFGVPKRSLFEETITKYEKEIKDKIENIFKNNPKDLYEIMGNYIISIMRDRIRNRDFLRNAQKTIENKLGDVPLLDTTQTFTSLSSKLYSK